MFDGAIPFDLNSSAISFMLTALQQGRDVTRQIASQFKAQRGGVPHRNRTLPTRVSSIADFSRPSLVRTTDNWDVCNCALPLAADTIASRGG